MKNKNQTGLKNFKPKINLNHNMNNSGGKEMQHTSHRNFWIVFILPLVLRFTCSCLQVPLYHNQKVTAVKNLWERVKLVTITIIL